MPSPADTPNIVFILSDDQGPWAARCCGTPEMITPNLDRLAAEGRRFTSFFCTSPVCSPSRASFLTGSIPSQHGVHDWIKPPGHDYHFLAGKTAYTDVLAAHGYRVGFSGKWHMGLCHEAQNGAEFWFSHQRGGGDYYKPRVWRDGQAVTEDTYVSELFTDEALTFLDRQTGDAPFYLGLHFTAPHSPWERHQHPEDIQQLYDDCDFASIPVEPRHPDAIGLTDHAQALGKQALIGYFAAITAMDQQIGRVLDKLDAMGVADDTLVIFTSDNGFSCGHNGFWGKGNGTNPLNMYENSVKLPFIARHPGRIPAGTTCDAMVSAYDFMPTLLDYVGLPCPTEALNLPGRSAKEVFLGADERDGGPVVVFDEYGPTRMIRSQTWKYVHRDPDGPHELYDLAADPTEHENLIADPNHADRVATMRAELLAWFDQYIVPGEDARLFPVDGSGQPYPRWDEHRHGPRGGHVTE